MNTKLGKAQFLTQKTLFTKWNCVWNYSIANVYGASAFLLLQKLVLDYEAFFRL